MGYLQAPKFEDAILNGLENLASGLANRYIMRKQREEQEKQNLLKHDQAKEIAILEIEKQSNELNWKANQNALDRRNVLNKEALKSQSKKLTTAEELQKMEAEKERSPFLFKRPY